MKKHIINTIVFACAALISVLMPQKARALCLGTVIKALPSVTTFSGGAGEYGVFDLSQYVQNVGFEIESLATIGGCRYFVTLDAGASGNQSQRHMVRGGDTLNYNAYTSAAVTNVLNGAGSHNGANVISGTFPFILGITQTNSHSLYWTITPQQIKSASATPFEDSAVTLRVWAELALGIFTNTDSKTISFRARAESDIALSLVDSGAPININDTTQTIDFGYLVSGDFLIYDTIIRSNDGYNVTLQSQNGQYLLHEGHPSVAAAIPYTVLFGGSAVNLLSGAPVTAAMASGVTPATGERFPTRFTVGTMDGTEPAGNYQDIITVTVSAN